MTLTLLPEAEAELLASVDWYEAQRPGLGLEFLGSADRLLPSVGA